MSQRRLLLLLLLCLSIESVMSRALSSDEWQRLAGTGANVFSDTILPCVESGSCRGRAFGSMSEDVSKFGNVPPCRFHGWVRCIEYGGPSIMDADHGQYVPSSKYYHQPNKDSLSQQQKQRPYPTSPRSDARQSPQQYDAPYPSKAAGQDRPANEPPRFVSANTQSSFAHHHQQQESNWQQEQQKEREMRQQHSIVEIPKHVELQRNTGAVQFQQHPDAVLLAPVNKQSVGHWGNQPGAQRSHPQSQGLTQPIQRPVEFQTPHQRFEQSSQQLINPSKFTQQQLTQNEVPGSNFVEPPRLSQQSPNNQQQPVQFRQLTQPGQHILKTSPLAHHAAEKIGSQQFPAVETQQRPFIKIIPMPVESQRPTSASESNKPFQQMPQRVEPIQTMNSNPSFRLVEGGQQIIDPRRFIEQPPSQRERIEPQQRFVQVNQPDTALIKNEHPQQMARETNREAQRLPKANQQLVELQRPPRPLAGQQPIVPENSFQIKQQRPATEPVEPQRLQPPTTQRSAEPRRLEPPPLVKSNSLGESPQFIEPAKSPLENIFQFDSSMDTQLAREQLADLIRLLAQSASQQQTDPNKEMFGVTATTNQLLPTSKSESNVVPFIAFSEPLPLEPIASSLNSLF